MQGGGLLQIPLSGKKQMFMAEHIVRVLDPTALEISARDKQGNLLLALDSRPGCLPLI